MNTSRKKCLIVAGGTGGHINAALAIGSFLENKNFKIRYASGTRPLDLKLTNKDKTKYFDARSLVGKSVNEKIKSIFANIKVFFTALGFVKEFNPAVVIGCGGYICGPVLLAAFILRKKVCLLEQNGVMGLTNKILSLIAHRIFLNFKETIGVKHSKNIIFSGNPVREEILNFKAQNPTAIKNILVFGGSLGAKEINDLTAKFVQEKIAKNFKVRHQVGNSSNTISHLKKSDHYEPLVYIENMAEQYQWCDLIICRAGASTISELKYVQKPVILIPLRLQKDQHQVYNADLLKAMVQFPVYIHSGKELSHHECGLLKNILDFLSEPKHLKYKIIKNSAARPEQIIFDNLPIDV
jgi:UDP-N-acetylglucosamine--N-acetylmuramyl-(pentapeptide) pyrophosphoryl-undecaprenol N-acetylglucosamine transferase